MNLNKYVYVSPQQFIKAIGEWRYEYVVDGTVKRSATFGYHQGKDVFRKIELEAWRLKKEVRKLSRWEWDAFCLELHDKTYITLEGQQIRFYSSKQKKRFIAEVSTQSAVVKIIRQFTDGDIVLHHIFEDEGRLLGFAIIIGPRGGYRTIHEYEVELDDDNQPYLARRNETLFNIN